MKWYIQPLTKNKSLLRQSLALKKCKHFLCPFLRDFRLRTASELPEEMLPVALGIADSAASSEDTAFWQCLPYSGTLPSDLGLQRSDQPSVQ